MNAPCLVTGFVLVFYGPVLYSHHCWQSLKEPCNEKEEQDEVMMMMREITLLVHEVIQRHGESRKMDYFLGKKIIFWVITKIIN